MQTIGIPPKILYCYVYLFGLLLPPYSQSGKAGLYTIRSVHHFNRRSPDTRHPSGWLSGKESVGQTPCVRGRAIGIQGFSGPRVEFASNRRILFCFIDLYDSSSNYVIAIFSLFLSFFCFYFSLFFLFPSPFFFPFSLSLSLSLFITCYFFSSS
ncbi:hypothetical protein F5Y09DRAFT_36379 [Xylaria sp. FL1042]|nr:hypothetical protein F5Y09DRAFT_36379 [Xylaria sp. FL1042]